MRCPSCDKVFNAPRIATPMCPGCGKLINAASLPPDNQPSARPRVSSRGLKQLLLVGGILGGTILLACCGGMLVLGTNRPSDRDRPDKGGDVEGPLPRLSGKVSGHTYQGFDSRVYAHMYHDTDRDTSDKGLEGLVAIGDDLAVKTFVEALDGPYASRKVEAAGALYKIGPPARAALPALRKAARSTDKEMRLYASQAIEKISPP